MEDDDDDEWEDFGIFPPKVSGYIEQRIDACSNCGFGDSDQEGCHYCKLYPSSISVRGRIKMCHFVLVDVNGKCRHYRPRKEKYRLGGAVAFDELDLSFGYSRKKDEDENDESD